MTDLPRGGNAPLDATSLQLSVTGAERGTVDLMIFQLAQDRKVRSDDDFVFFNQPASPEDAVRLTGPDSITVQLAKVPADVATLAVAVALDDSVPGSLADRAGLAVQVGGGSGPVTAAATGLQTERAAVLVEIYRRNDAWKVRNVSAGWDAGLPALAAEHGVDVGSSPEPATPATPPPPPAAPPAGVTPPPPPAAPPAGLTPPPPPAPTPAPPAPTPAPAPPAPTAASGPPLTADGKIDLGKRTGQISLVKGQRVAIDGSEVIVASITWPAATDYDVYALIRYADGHDETVATFGTRQHKQFSLTSSDGAVRHLGDVRRATPQRLTRKERKELAAQGRTPPPPPPAVERIEIRPHQGLVAVVPVVYSAQSNGTGSFRRYQVSMSIDNGRGTSVSIDAPNADDDDTVYTCVPGIIRITDAGVVIDSVEQYSQRKSERRPVITPALEVEMDAGDVNEFK